MGERRGSVKDYVCMVLKNVDNLGWAPYLKTSLQVD
jgi:hypothetical protein